MLYWTPGESDRNTRADERYDAPTNLPTPTSPADLVAQFWTALSLSERDVRARFDARNAREVA